MSNTIEMKFAPTPEKLDFRIDIAAEKDWEACKNLRELAITGDDAKMFNANPESVAYEKQKTEEEWRKDLSSDTVFYVLSQKGSEPIGIGSADQIPSMGEGVWGLHDGYVKLEFRGNHIAQKMFATRINEIQRRGGKLVVAYIRMDNEKQLNLAKKFGFEKYGENPKVAPEFQRMALDLSEPKDFSQFLEEDKK